MEELKEYINKQMEIESMFMQNLMRSKVRDEKLIGIQIGKLMAYGSILKIIRCIEKEHRIKDFNKRWENEKREM